MKKSNTQSAKTTLTPVTIKVAGTPTTVKPMYHVSQMTNRTNKNLWVVFPAGNESEAVIYSGTFNRDTVRNAGSKVFGKTITEIRSQRVSTFRK